MFTGTVQALGRIRFAKSGDFAVETPGEFTEPLSIGDSIAVNGVCLTVRALEPWGFVADVSGETARRSTLGSLRPGQSVNLEVPMRPEAGLHGHWVLGHVDATGKVQALYKDGFNWILIVAYPTQFRRYVVEKGSIAVEGISLTPYDLDGASFKCAIIPETYQNTVLKDRRRGDLVNLEFDVLAKYVERMMRFAHTD